MRHLRIPMLLLALCGLIALAGCGGGSDSTSSDATSSATETTATDATSTATDSTSSTSAATGDYGQQLTTIISDFGTSFQTLGPQISKASNPQEFDQLLGQAESGIQTTIDDLKALDPPEGAQEGQDQLVSAFENYASKLKAAGDAVASGDQSAVKKATTELQQGVAEFQTDLQTAAQSLQAAGVSIGGPTGG